MDAADATDDGWGRARPTTWPTAAAAHAPTTAADDEQWVPKSTRPTTEARVPLCARLSRRSPGTTTSNEHDALNVAVARPYAEGIGGTKHDWRARVCSFHGTIRKK